MVIYKTIFQNSKKVAYFGDNIIYLAENKREQNIP